MALYDIMERLYHHPETACGKYEQGIVEGMTYMADKLIWGEEYYLDAFHANGGTYEKNWPQREADMFKILNDTIQNFISSDHPEILKIRHQWDNDAYQHFSKIKMKEQ